MSAPKNPMVEASRERERIQDLRTDDARRLGGSSPRRPWTASIGVDCWSRKRCSMATDDDALDLGPLLAALAQGAKAAATLPVADDFEFQASFPEFAGPLQEAQAVYDPTFWESIADTCDVLVEQVEAYLNEDTVLTLDQLGQAAWQKSQSSYTRMLDGVVDMPKPQETYRIVRSNDRTRPFIPKVHPDKPFGVVPLSLELQPGSGYETRMGSLQGSSTLPPDVIVPDQYVKHPYQKEIEDFVYTEKQLQAEEPVGDAIPKRTTLSATWIDTPEALQTLVQRLEENVTEIALDLEAHSYRSFAGLVCLLQLTVRNEEGAAENYLVDTLKLFHDLNAALAPALANPKIVKVMHGADSDIQWLQRDFGLYVVNLFDTGRAARALHYPSAGLAHLLHRFVGIEADKSHQLADWRQRPLTDDMEQYAIQDTHYLLDIYDRLRWELEQSKSETSIRDVLDTSRKLCLIRYAGEAPFSPTGYRVLLSRRGRRQVDLNDVQRATLESLWEWRDATARREDESPIYVCPNQSLLRIATSRPSTLASLQALFKPLPPLVLRHSSEILDRIRNSGDDSHHPDDDDEVARSSEGTMGTPSASSAFFKPATGEKERLRRGMMSPVLATEALFQRAGWTTPFNPGVGDNGPSSSAADTEIEGTGKPRRLLAVDSSNDNFIAKASGDRGLEFSGGAVSGIRSADGTATVNVSKASSGASVVTQDGESYDLARSASSQISGQLKLTSNEAIPSVLGLISNAIGEEEEDAAAPEGAEGTAAPQIDEADYPIPKSMREIYNISNRNRRFKKAGSPTPERGVTPTSEKEKEELAKAEALLRERGHLDTGYFEELPGSPGKRARTKSTGRESEESVPPETAVSKEEDINFMKEIGWIQSKAELDSITAARRDTPSRGTPGRDSAGGDSSRNTPYGSDYSNTMGLLNPQGIGSNPFFSGAALVGGPLTQATRPDSRTRKGNTGGQKGKPSKVRQPIERPEKKDSRMHAYRKRG